MATTETMYCYPERTITVTFDLTFAVNAWADAYKVEPEEVNALVIEWMLVNMNKGGVEAEYRGIEGDDRGSSNI